jgi:CHAD domain-containing protein
MRGRASVNYPKRYIKRQLRRMDKAVKGIHAANDIEDIHDARVAGRRLRTAFQVFKSILPKKAQGPWKKGIRRLARALGPARDLDVQLDFLNRMTRRLRTSPYKAPMEKLCALLQQNRDGRQGAVLAAVEAFEKTAILRKIEAGLDKSPRDKRSVTLEGLYGIGEKKVTSRLQDVFKFEPYVYRSGNVAELHQLRIAAKHLRYTLECLRPLYGKETNRFISAAKKIQSVLGRLHDFDVWMQTLPKAVPAEKRDDEVEQALSFFARRCARLRSAAYESFLTTWKKQRRQRVWYELPRFVTRYKGQEKNSPGA